ncbi:MAG: aminopeptidase P family protein [Firmicutes bacterium]|nr:aminopeptidase P family protein [Bacillota bacterium]
MSNVYEARIHALRAKLEGAGIDGLYVTDEYNVSYLTGTRGKDCTLWISQTEAVIITDFRYREMAQNLNHLTLFETSLQVPYMDFFRGLSCSRIGVEKNSLPLEKYLDMTAQLSGKTLVPVSGLIEALRQIKDEEEIRRIVEAQKLGDKTFLHMLDFIKAGMTELEVAAELEYFFRKNGADGLSFSTIAVSGPNSSYPHGIPSERKLQKGDFLTLDFGCVYKGYCGDMTRTVAIGQPTDEMRKVYDIVLQAQLSACDHIRAGLTGVECDAFARDVIKAAGYGEFFGHSLGHAVGLQVHESPRYSMAYTDPIPENVIVSIEPGIYLPGKFGVRIEDLAIVKKDGIINLNNAPKELIVL